MGISTTRNGRTTARVTSRAPAPVGSGAPPRSALAVTAALLALLVLGAILLAGCATAGPGGPGGSGSTDAPPSGTSAPAERYAAAATVIQVGDAPAELCLGGVMESYPPQCGGPELVGLDWDQVPFAESASGTTWATGWFVISYDGTRATLLETPSTQPPAGLEVPQPADPEFPALCEDPYRGGDEDALDADSPQFWTAAEALTTAAQELPGFVTMYVSDGSSAYNVIVTSDAEAAHAALREVWPGFLCVAQRDLPTAADVAAAQRALTPESVSGLLGSGSGADGVLDVWVVLDDDATRAAVEAAVGTWLTQDQVRLTPALVPLPE